MVSWAVILSALVYLCALFAVAHWGDANDRRLTRGRWRATLYAMALAVYCTSWTFYGSVGLASRSGLDFLTIYIGPILVIGLGHRLVARVVRIAKNQNSTSVADFVAARYGKSEIVAVFVTLIAVVGSVPYIALQLKAVSSSLQVFLAADGTPGGPGVPFFEDLALVVALVLAGFSIAFGTRFAAATEHQTGLVLAIAVESAIKLVAFLAVGIFVVAAGQDGSAALFSRAADAGLSAFSTGATSGPAAFGTLILLSASVSLLLPRQFHVTVVENRAVEDVKRAAWLFPLYLVLINLFVVPLAGAGLQVFPTAGTDRDMTVLTLPLAAGSGTVALVVFLGGLSAATAMVIAETVALSIMISSHVVIPLVLRGRIFAAPAGPPAGAPNAMGLLVLRVRRCAILAVLLLAYAYYRVAGGEELAAIGLLSFAAVAQIAPAFFGGLFWKRGTALGASAGLATGLSVWVYTLLLPALLDGEAALLSAGPLAIGALRPTALFGLDLPVLTHGTLWSLGLNALAYLAFSLVRPARPLERLQASAFVGAIGNPIAATLRPFRVGVSVDDLKAAVARFLGSDTTERSFAGFARSRGATFEGREQADIHLLRYAEHILASAIGASSSRFALSLVLRRRDLSESDALHLLDEASSAIQQNRDLLQHALDHAQQGINVLDVDLRLLCWNHAFVELYDFPRELVRIGVGLDEIVRVNAERGVYGGGAVDDLIAARLHSLINDPGPVRLRLATSGRVISTRSNQLPGGGLFITYTDVSDLAAEEEARERETEDLEERVRARTEELTRLNGELTRAKRDADEANASKTRFLAAASHDILQPLNAARLYTTALVESRDGDGRALAENIDASLEAVEEILTTLLDISRLDTGALKPRLIAVRVDDLFGQLARDYAPAAAEKGLRLRFVRTTLAVRSDRGMARRLLQNLVSNAVKYTPAGTVLVGARRVGATVRIEVRDTGIGIPESQQANVFREFQRLAEGARTAGGVGLGLSIVERLAKTLGVSVDLVSEPGRGTDVKVVLPRAQPPSEAQARTAGPLPGTRGGLDGLTVLALDNEPAILSGMAALLGGWGCTLHTARSLAEARALVEGGLRPEVVIADFHLDDGDGLEAVAMVRELLGIRLPALLLTADQSAALREGAAQHGLAILNKPLKPAALRALLARVEAVRGAGE